MNILILSAFSEEQAYYKKELTFVSLLKIGFIDLTICKTESATIYLATTGMGTINAACVLAILAHHIKPEAIFFSGTSGAIANLAIGDVVVAEEAFDADILSIHDAVIGTPFEGALIHPHIKEKTPSIFSGNNFLIGSSRSYTSATHNVFYGRIATSNHFPSPKELFEQIKLNNAMVIDMESAAIYQFGWLSKIPVLVVRGVSNKLDQQGQDDNVATSDVSSSDNAAKLVLSCIDTISKETSLPLTI